VGILTRLIRGGKTVNNSDVTIRHLTAIAVLSLAGCSSPPPRKAESPAQAAQPDQTPVKIGQFYAAPTHIGKGERAQVCYGVEGAAKVRLDPAVEEIWPAMSHCVEVHPNKTTTYTLTAVDSAGHSVTREATLEVGPPRPQGAESGGAGPRMIQEVTVNKLQVKPGEQVTICFTARHATSVTITPGQGVQQSAERGCIVDKPATTTTYQVVAKGPGGQTDTERVTVKVR
jgi:hypothetical protein